MTDTRAAQIPAAARRAGSRLPQTRKNRRDMEALGVSRRQLEYWVEMGWVSSADPPSQGHPRIFSDTEKRVLALMVRLTAAGLPARKAAALARQAVTAVEEWDGSPPVVALGPGLLLEVRDI